MKYRQCRWGVKDHGIFGGIILYSELEKIRTNNNNNNGDLYWGGDLTIAYACIAWTITCHNIFYINNNDNNINCYKHYKLNDFITEKGRQILSNKNPILFLFCLVDAIDPVKILGGTEKFKDITIAFNDSNISIDLSKLEEHLKIKYSKAIKELNFWLTDTSEECADINLIRI